MPILSRKTARKPFKPPIQAKENIEKILGIESQKDKTAEIDNALNDSTVSSTSTDISNRLNEPAIKKLYMDFTVNLSKKILCSTPIPSSQGVKEEADLANMSFKDHMMNVISNSQPEPIVIAISDDELNKEDCETSLSQNIFNQDDLDFMKNFKKTKNVKNIFSSDEMGKRDDKIPAKSKKVEKKSIRKVCAGMPLEEITQNAQLKGDKAAEKPKKQGKPRVRKQKLSKANKNEVAMDEDLRKLISSEESDVLSASKETEQEVVCENSLYDIGTVVWAKIDGYPWWPAMVDEDPDFDTHIWVEEHVKEPTWYHVTFFDTAQVTRAWVRPNRIRDYKNPIVTMEKLCPRMRSARLKGSLKQAENALEMSWSSRLAKYRFTVR
ncbi:unnamed protein product [Acanthoscelides obtectus]|nr:unnamed protein product [Acanthoscelides obtectus]CAK1626491.1 Zinc finger CW-type PWWP domain protein 1 [Acanthoscelides obtectus]